MTDTGSTAPDDPTAPVGVTAEGLDAEEQAGAAPWYRRPISWILIAVLLLSLALGLVLAFGGDDGDADAATVTIDRIDSVANPIETEMIGSVRAVTDPDAYRWVTPSNAVAPGDAVARTDGSGTITFRWGPTSEVDDPREWASTLTMTEALPANTNLVSERFDCTLRRGDEPDTLVVLTVVVETPADPEQPSIATYDFQNFEFLTADIMTCGVPNAQPGATTTSTITTPTTAPPTTVPVTTAPATTVPPTTAPAPAPTTAPPTTTPETSAPLTTAPATSIMGVIESRSDLSTLVGLIDVAGLRDDLSNPGTITLFAPDDPAFDALLGGPDAPDVGDPDTVEGLLLAHTNLAEVLPAADVLALLEVEVANGGPQPVDAGAGTIGGAPIAETDLTADNGVVHVLGAVMPVQPAG